MDLLISKKLWLTARDLQREFGCSRSTIYALAAAGFFGVPLRLGSRPGAGLRFHREDVLRAIEARREELSAELGILSPGE
jgi:predicted DNA-binding transcriptional regulator AlpA